MTSNRKRKTQRLLLQLPMLLLILLSGCSPSNVAELQKDRVVRLIDEKRYQDAITLLESPDAQAAPESASLQPYLAQAYLGAGGFEPMKLAEGVLGAQTPRNDAMKKIFGQCGMGAISNFDAISVPCILMRLANQLPDADDAHFKRGREILLAAFPDVASTPADQNTLIAVVEVSSAISRLIAVAGDYQGKDPSKLSDDDLNRFLEQIAEITDEGQQGLDRAKNGTAALMKLVTGLDSATIFAAAANTPAGQYVEATALPLLKRFAEGGADKTQVVPTLNQAVGILQN